MKTTVVNTVMLSVATVLILTCIFWALAPTNPPESPVTVVIDEMTSENDPETGLLIRVKFNGRVYIRSGAK